MPTLRLHVPDADLDLIRRAAEFSNVSVKRLIVEAAEQAALAIVARKAQPDDSNRK